MSELKNPIRISIKNRTWDAENWLHHPQFSEKRITELEIRPSEGNIYIHWEEADNE